MALGVARLPAMGHVDTRANAIGATQHGLATRRQLRGVEIGYDTIRRRVVEAIWRERLPGVIDLGTHGETWWQSAQALLLAAGSGAVLSHDTAGFLHDLPDVRRPATPDVLVRRGRHPAIGEVRLHTTVRLGEEEVMEVDGWPVTAGGRTILDCAPHRSDDWLQLSIGQLVRRGVATLTEVVESAALRPGAAATGRVVRACAGLPANIERTESILEVRGVIALTRIGLQPPALQHWVRLAGSDYRFDAAWPSCKVAVEFDSKAWHDTEIRSGADALRDGNAERDGWVVIRLRQRDIADPAASPGINRLRRLVL